MPILLFFPSFGGCNELLGRPHFDNYNEPFLDRLFILQFKIGVFGDPVTVPVGVNLWAR